MEDEESLKTGTVIGETTNSLHDVVDEFFTDRVVSTGVVVGGVFFTVDEGFGVEEGSVLSGPDFVDHVRLQVDLEGRAERTLALISVTDYCGTKHC